MFLQAIERWQWLIIDELNRADVDRAFGELMTVLAGKASDSAFELDDGRSVSIGPDARCTHRTRPTFRVVATMNTWDKTSLFRLSYAVQRRFAVVHVGIPDDATYAHLIDRFGATPGIDPPLTIAVRFPSGEARAVVIEVKLSSDPVYLLKGYQEAQLYRAEYLPALTGWPKAILVASGHVPGAPRLQDDVIAASWDRWVPPEVTAGLLMGL